MFKITLEGSIRIKPKRCSAMPRGSELRGLKFFSKFHVSFTYWLKVPRGLEVPWRVEGCD
ncbi:hypothetical protein GIB67_040348 [Kingdonia uniflora]|uniref:Uncharacterized protein n=1 Tax=Kingdonia uniflora TaxID=39325 RepID=A0A7J7L979_9MAGN|nr:hypothetical protein GIB67_040348 [Kingdonia uniflora]